MQTGDGGCYPGAWVTSSGDTLDMDGGIHSQQQQQNINLRVNFFNPRVQYS